jgi:hypothetical protein
MDCHMASQSSSAFNLHFCARHMPIKWLHNGALYICFECIHRAKDVPGGVVAKTKNFVGNGIQNCANPVPWVLGQQHFSNENRGDFSRREERGERGEGRGERGEEQRQENTSIVSSCAIFFVIF